MRLFWEALPTETVVLGLILLPMVSAWGPGRERGLLLISVFLPPLPFPTDIPLYISSTYWIHEKEKKRVYSQTICEVEYGTFSHLFSLQLRGDGQGSYHLFQKISFFAFRKVGATMQRDHGLATVYSVLLLIMIFCTVFTGAQSSI